MRKKVRFIAAVLTVILVVTSFPLTIFAADNNYTYQLALLDDGTVKIAGFTGTPTEIDIGADMKNYGYTVTAIGDAAFANNSTLEKITMPDTINSIGCDAFMYCTKLKNITLSQNISLLDWNIFEGCYALESIAIPEGVTTIDFQAFNKCSALKSISIPKSVKTIEAQAFKDCTALTDIYYSGTESEWNNINISSTANNWLTSAIKHFSFCGIKQVALGGYHSAALTDDGDLYIWGDNSNGQLGNGTTVDSSTPIKILTDVESVELGSYHSAAIMKNGDLYMWGANDYGELGVGTYTDSTIPVKVMSNVSAVSLPKDNDSWRVAAITESKDLYMWGYNSNGELGNGSTTNCPTPQKVLSGVAKVEFGVCHTAAISTSGTLYMWGCNGTYRLGNGSESNCYTPISVMNGVADVKLGTENSAAITTAGIMYTWGSNWYGQIGMNNHTAYARKVPYSVLSNVKEIPLADNTTIAVTNSGELYGWGSVRFDTFGPQDYDYVPVKYADNISSFISTGWLLNGYAIDDNNSLLSFNGATSTTMLENVKHIYSGEQGSYAALTNNNELYMWGDNSSGQIGNGTTSESEAITKVELDGSNQDDEPSDDPIEDFTPSLKYGADRFNFGENITGYVGETLDTLVVYTTKEENIASLDISSSNSNVAEIGTIEIGNGEYITGESECIATIPLNLKAVGTSTITITSPEGVSESIVVTVEDVCYEIKVYSSFPTLVIDKNSSSIIGLQTERNGEVWNDECQYTIAVSNSNIVTTSNLKYTSDGGAYLTLNGHNEGMAKITITESKSGAVFSTTISVAEQILTYNSDAFKNTSIDDLGCNGVVSGLYIDGFTVSEPVNNYYPVSFKVYNSKNIVGVVEVYDSNGQLKASNNIKRFDGGTVTSIQDIFVSGWEVLEDASDGTLGTYKDLIHSEETQISVDVPIGGYIKITNNPTVSETCAIYNCTEFLVNSYLLYGNVLDEVKGSVYSGTNEEIAKMVAESASKEVVADFINGKISSDEVDDKLNSMGTRLMAELLKVTTELVSSNYLKGTADSFVEVCKLIFNESGIDIVELIQENAVSLGFSGLEQYVLDEVGLVGDVISATFMAAETHQYTGYVVALFGKAQYEEMDIHFNAVDGSLVSNGVSIKSENGELALTESNFVMHSIVLSNEEDLTNEAKKSLDDISNDYVVRDIYLERDGVVSQPGQTVQVYMPVPDNYDPNKCKLYWVKDDGTLEQKEFTIVGNNIMFTTDHFSYWALVKESSVIDGQCGDNLTYSYDTTIHTLTITGEGDMWNWTLDELPPWDEFKETIRHIKVESGVTTIGSRAFPKCTALESVELPNSIVTIGNIAFASCTALTDITLPYGVSSLGNSVFIQCTNLKTFTFPSTITSIGDFVFQNCTNLKTVTIENGITNIGECVFQDCTSLENVKLPDSVTSIGGHIFAGCTSLTSATIGAGLTKISEWAFWGCSELETVNFLGNIVDIGSHAFYECIKLKNIEIPDRVTSIGECAFEGCSAIENAKIPSSATSVGSWAFKNCIALESLTIENGVTDINQGTFLGCTGLVNVEISGSVNNMGHYAFAGCSNLMNVTILNDQISIASTTFSDCEELVLYGHNESTTEMYANENGIPFVEIGNIRIDSVSIKTTPTKATYYIGDSLSTSGLKLLVTYSDGSTETITSGFTTSGFSSTSAGTKTITVSYEGLTVTFTVTVKTPSITLSSSSKSMTVGDSTTITATTTPSAQTVVWTSSNTSVAIVSGGTITAKASGSTTVTAKFTYNGITYSEICSIVVNKIVVLESISVISIPTKTTYFIGDSLSTSGLKLLATYSDGSTETITSGFTTSGFSSTSAGTKTVMVSYEGVTDTFVVSVETPKIYFDNYETDDMVGLYLGVPKTFEVTTTPGIQNVTLSVTHPEYLSISGNTVTATEDVAGLMTIIAEFTYNGITYRDTIIASVLNFATGFLGEDRQFYMNFKTGTLSIEGCGNMPNFEDFGAAPWNDFVEHIEKIKICEGITSIGNYAFVNCINAKEVEIANTVKSIGTWAFEDCWSIETLIIPESVEKIDDHAFAWCGGLKDIYVHNDDVTLGKNALNCEYRNATIHGYKNSTAEAHAAQYGRTFKAFAPTSMTISKAPLKTTYYVGDSINVDGLQLTLTYGNGYTEMVSTGFTLDEADLSSAGDKTLVVIYGNLTDTFTVTVKTPSITLSSSTKSMTVGDSHTITATITPSGQSVTWTSSNTNVATVSNGTITAKGTGTANITAKFTYNGVIYSAVCTVMVNDDIIARGDINGDGAVDAGDAVLISRYDAGFITLTAEQLEAGDVNGDGEVDAGDAVIISRYDAGLISQIGY